MAEYRNGRVVVYAGDCLATMAGMSECSVDACVTDPPYHLASIVKRLGADNAAPIKSDGATGVYARSARGFMGKKWDGGGIAFDPATWAAVLRVMKPGAHLVAFGAPKNAHRLTCAIEDAGFEIRDVIMWLFGSGFPKSHNIADGWGTALKPAYEPIILARKALVGIVADNVAEFGTGAINIDACRVPTDDRIIATRNTALGRMNDDAWQPKPGVYEQQAGGRWPANVIHDGSEEVLAAFPDAPGAIRGVGPEFGAKDSVNTYGDFGPRQEMIPRGDSGSAARFFYTAKADSYDRAGSKHPTVKPLDLMRYLCRLVTPPGGSVIDPFAGTGTTGEAAILEGFRAILCEREPEYLADIDGRFNPPISGAGPLFASPAK